jgi:hypothetical protein
MLGRVERDMYLSMSVSQHQTLTTMRAVGAAPARRTARRDSAGLSAMVGSMGSNPQLRVGRRQPIQWLSIKNEQNDRDSRDTRPAVLASSERVVPYSATLRDSEVRATGH